MVEKAYVGPAILGPIEPSLLFGRHVMKFEVGVTKQAERYPSWLDVLLNNQLSIRLGSSIYSFDLRTSDSDRYFFTLYDPHSNGRISLMQAEFEIKKQVGGSPKLFLPFESQRGQNEGLFADAGYLAYIGKRNETGSVSKPFDWIGHYMHEQWDGELLRFTNAADQCRILFVYMIGQIARVHGVTEIDQEMQSGIDRVPYQPTPYLFWHPYFLELIKKSILAGPVGQVGCLASISPKKRALAENQGAVLIDNFCDPFVAEAGTTGAVNAEDRDKLYAESARQRKIQTEGERSKNIILNARHKAVAALQQIRDLPVYATDIAPSIICNQKGNPLKHFQPRKLTTDTPVRIMAQGFDDIGNLAGATVIMHNAQAIAMPGIDNLNIPVVVRRPNKKRHDGWSFDVGKELDAMEKSGEVITSSGVYRLMIRFRGSIPQDVLRPALSDSSGLGIDVYPQGALNHRLAYYISHVWINTGNGWKDASLENPLVKGIILGFSPELFTEISAAFGSIFPFSVKQNR